MNAVELQGICKNYGSYKALDHVSIAIPKGYITGLIGPNGAGKSTLIRMMMGLVLPDEGEISILNNKNMMLKNGSYKKQIGYVADESIFYDHLNAIQMKSIIAPFYDNWDKAIFDKYMNLFEIPSKKKLRTFSKGMKMKFSLALALAQQPSLLIMDEPTAGLDPIVRRELLDILADYILDEEKTVLFSTHLTTDLDKIADYIAFLHQGKMVMHDTKDQILEQFVLVKGPTNILDGDTRKELIGIRETAVGFEAMSKNRQRAVAMFGNQVIYEHPTLEEIMYYTVKGEKVNA
ncbi:ABC transporter ATP-binding protein [Paenibacillus turicensis]|uniref:ABC transporter ATP-binding protein n=1 Tax=Paenibacillus turicensis TaxID=160487 RepID=UPI003D2D2BE3